MIGPILPDRDVVGETRPGRIQITGQIKSSSWGNGKEVGGMVVMKIGTTSQWEEIFWTPGLTCERRAGTLSPNA